MKGSALFRQLESDAQFLEKVSREYERTSPEYQSLRRAALSLAYVVMNERSEFATFLEEIDGDLSDEERKDLRERYGIET